MHVDTFRRIFLNSALFLMFFIIFFSSCFVFSRAACAEQRIRVDEDILSVTFPNEKDGWASARNGLILHTSDGGQSWRVQNSGTDFTLASIFFLDSQTGWAVGDQGTIIHTKDGGKTWIKQKCPVSFYLMGVRFVSPLKGWIVTEQTHILHTTNGGKTWEIQFSDKDFILRAVSFANELIGWVVGEYGYVYHTEDGGVTWKHQLGHYRIDENDEIVGGNYLFAVKTVDERTVWAVGIDGYVIKTEDGGKTWKEVHVGIKNVHLFTVAAADKGETIVIGGNAALRVSTNAGKSWQSPELRPHITYGGIYGLSNVGSSHFVAVGRKGVIYYHNKKNVSSIWELSSLLK